MILQIHPGITPTLLQKKNLSARVLVQNTLNHALSNPILKVLTPYMREYRGTAVTVSGVTGGGGRTAPGNTLQGVTPERKNFCMAEYTKNDG